MVPPVNFGAAPLLREDSLRSGDPLRATAGNASPGMFRDIANTHAQKKENLSCYESAYSHYPY